MINDTIFPILSISRDEIKWDDYLYELTPVQKVGRLYFKRDDHFAPLGYGGINGSKLRQAIWLVKNYIDGGGSKTIYSGASVKSPQLPMASAVATHFGLKSKHVIGATKPETAIKHENVKMATWFGAEFDIIKVGYNPVLQKRVLEILDDGSYYLSYGITPNLWASNQEILSFHMLGANQVENIGDSIEKLVLPAGSCNSCISILLGIMLSRPRSLRDIYLVGIGPNKMKFINERLTMMSKLTGSNLLNFNLKFETNDLIGVPSSDAINLHYYDLHKEGFTDYQKEIPFHYMGIDFHPTYEGKCLAYMFMNYPEVMDGETLFWVVGSKPYIKNMSFLEDKIGVIPEKIANYD